MQSVKPKCKIQNEMTDFVVKFDDTRTLCERIESRKLSPFVYAQGRPDAESSTSAILDSRFRGNDKEENQSPYNTMHAGSLVEGLKVNNPESEMCRARIK